MDTVIDNLGNPVFGALIFLLLALIVVRKAIFLIIRPYIGGAKAEDRGSTRIKLFIAVVAAILVGSGLIYTLSPSVRDEFSFLRSSVAEDNEAMSNLNELCFKRIVCYDMQAARLRCADSAEFNECMVDRLGARLSVYVDNCGKLDVLFDDARVSNLGCILRNTASVLFSPSAKVHRALGSR